VQLTQRTSLVRCNQCDDLFDKTVTPGILEFEPDTKRKEALVRRIDDLRCRANRYRRLAAIPTTRGHREDLLLLKLADDLECEAGELETQLAETKQV
jgi:hypothetical protein